MQICFTIGFFRIDDAECLSVAQKHQGDAIAGNISIVSVSTASGVVQLGSLVQSCLNITRIAGSCK